MRNVALLDLLFSTSGSSWLAALVTQVKKICSFERKELYRTIYSQKVTKKSYISVLNKIKLGKKEDKSV